MILIIVLLSISHHVSLTSQLKSLSKTILLIIMLKEVVAGFDFTFGKFGKGNMAVLNEIDEFNTTIVGKLDLDSEKFQQHQLDKRYMKAIYKKLMMN